MMAYRLAFGRPPTQEERAATADVASSQTMRPVVRGRTWAVSTMKLEATRAAEKILLAGGNAFDAAVAAQAVLGQVDPAMNGVGSDAELLLYDAKTKQVVSINAEGPAPRLATIDWYKKNNGGKLRPAASAWPNSPPEPQRPLRIRTRESSPCPLCSALRGLCVNVFSSFFT